MVQKKFFLTKKKMDLFRLRLAKVRVNIEKKVHMAMQKISENEKLVDAMKDCKRDMEKKIENLLLRKRRLSEETDISPESPEEKRMKIQ